jgi:hypothetical protein
MSFRRRRGNPGNEVTEKVPTFIGDPVAETALSALYGVQRAGMDGTDGLSYRPSNGSMETSFSGYGVSPQAVMPTAGMSGNAVLYTDSPTISTGGLDTGNPAAQILANRLRRQTR